jgi:lysozyme
MAIGSDILKEFVIALGFRLDDRSVRNVQGAIEKMFRNMTSNATQSGGLIELALEGVTIAAGTATAAVGVMAAGFVLLEKAVGRVATGMAQMYYQAQRAGSTVHSLRAVESAAQKIGFKEGEGGGAVEAIGLAVQANPGLQGLLRSLGVDPKGDTADVFSSLLERLQKMPSFLAQQYAKYFGMGESQYLQYRANLPAYLAERKNFAATEKASGFDADKAAEESVRFERAMVDLNQQFKRLGGMLAVELMPYLTKFNSMLAKFFETFQRSGRAHEVLGHLHQSLERLFAVLSKHKDQTWTVMIKAFDLMDWVVKDIGKEMDDVSNTTKEFAGYVDMVKNVISWLWDHTPDWAKKVKVVHDEARDKFWKWVMDPTARFWGKGTGPDAEKVGEDLRAASGRTYEAVGDWLSDFIKHRETFQPTAYPDEGHMAIGYGHQIQPGEEYLLKGPITKEKAEELYQQDAGKARANVRAATKGVKLNPEMLDSLTDLAYNLGGLSMDKTKTMLDALRSGDNEGAAKAFALYKKAGGVDSPALVDRRAADAAHFRLGMSHMVPEKIARHLHLSHDTKITVNGASEPQAVARHVANEQQRIQRDAVRNVITKTY